MCHVTRYCCHSSADAMPVSIKGEPRNADASQHPQPPPHQPPPHQPPPHQPPPPPALRPVSTTNGSTPAAYGMHASSTGVPPSNRPGAARPAPNASQPVPTPATPSTMQSANGTVPAPAAETEKPEDAIDYDSVRGVFGWATLDNVSVPCIIRKGKQFVAVRIVEKKVLNKYPNSFPDELGRKEPLVSYFVTEAEAALLNEINTDHCSYEYGQQPFTTKDLIVDLVEFEDFYNLVKKTFPDNVLASITARDNAKRSSVDERKILLSKACGWMQINNTVTPYIYRSHEKYVPLSVIQYAAQLLTKEQVEGHLPSAEECELLNDTCRAAGFDFTFGRNTKLLHITEVMKRCEVKIFELPFENPLQHAQYIDSLNQGDGTGLPAPLIGPSGIVGRMALPFQSRPTFTEGPPNMNPFSPYNPFMSMMNMMSQAPVSAPNHMHPRAPQMAGARSMPGGPQLSMVRTQTAPVFYPPTSAGAASQSRGSQVNNSVMSRTSGPVPGVHGKAPTPPGVPALHGLHHSPPQGHLGAPGMAATPGQFQGHRGIPGPGQLPQISSQSPLSRAPPPSYPVTSHIRQTLNHPSTISPSAQLGSTPHAYMPSPHPGSSPDMVIPGVGPVSRGVPMVGFPRGTMPAHMGVPRTPQPQALAQSQPHPPHSQPHAMLHHHPPPGPRLPQGGGSAVRTQFPNNAVNQAGPPSHANPALPTSNSPVYPVQLSHAAQQNQSHSGRLGAPESASKTPPETASIVPTQGPDEHVKLVGDIRAEMVNGKSISCLNRNSPERLGSFCLVEAVAKLYFPRCSLSEFVNALQNVLRINLPVCTEPEAKAFIHFYNLPVAKLNDNHMISLQDLKNYFPQISYMFQHAALDSGGATQGQYMSSNSRGGGRSKGTEGGHKKLASPSAPITIVLNNNDSGDVISIDSESPTQGRDSSGGGQNSKHKMEECEGAGGKHSRSSDQRGPYRVDEVDGNGTAPPANNTTGPSKPTSQVIVID